MEEKDEELTLNQQKIYKELTKLDKKSGIAFIGALKVLKDTSNPDRFYQAANSIRHLGAIISRQIEGVLYPICKKRIPSLGIATNNRAY